MKLIVLSNCTHNVIASYIRACGVFEEVDSHAVYLNDCPARRAILETLDDYDRILTILNSEAWQPLDTASLKERYGERLLSFPSIYFRGIHPDLVTVKAGEKTLPWIQSASALHFYCEGIGPAEAARRMAAGDSPHIKPQSVWDGAVRGLRAKDAISDIPITDILEEECSKGPAMLTVNHPRNVVMARMADRALTRWGFSARKVQPDDIRSDLWNNQAFPVFDYVPEALGFTYRAPQRFLFSQNSPQPELSAEDFVRWSYGHYAKAEAPLTIATPGFDQPRHTPRVITQPPAPKQKRRLLDRIFG